MTISRLKDTCLCAIVRDEVINPAGGITDFVNSVVPHVEQAVIVDTGSMDGTRELIEEAQAKHPNLAVRDYKFSGFSDARNYSLSVGKSRGKWAFVLDADERVTEEGFRILSKDLQIPDIEVHKTYFEHITPEGSDIYISSHNERLFANTGYLQFIRNLYECIGKLSDRIHQSDAIIHHFLPSDDARICKRSWYNEMRKSLDRGDDPLQPSRHPNFNQWKKINPQRGKYQ